MSIGLNTLYTLRSWNVRFHLKSWLQAAGPHSIQLLRVSAKSIHGWGPDHEWRAELVSAGRRLAVVVAAGARGASAKPVRGSGPLRKLKVFSSVRGTEPGSTRAYAPPLSGAEVLRPFPSSIRRWAVALSAFRGAPASSLQPRGGRSAVAGPPSFIDRSSTFRARTYNSSV